MGWFGWRPYVSVAERRAKALKKMEKLKKKGLDVKPVNIQGKKIVRTFWGEAWCDHLESFSDYENRLPRGRTYVRNGSVCHLDISPGKISAMVSGSQIYEVDITIKPLAGNKWAEVIKSCSGQIGSLLELLAGRLSKNIMAVVTHREKGLFPLPGEINLSCSCPDWAVMCKHVAAVLYGVGARLDEFPELLFLLRGVDHEELITADVDVAISGKKAGRRHIAEDVLSDVFGIEMREDEPVSKAKPTKAVKKAVKIKAKTSKVAGKNGRKKPPEKKFRLTVAPPKPIPFKRKARTPLEKEPVTGEAVAALRAKFGMNRVEFARLLGVSVPSVVKWEKAAGVLDLQAKSLAAFNTSRKLTKTKALRKLEE
ncbi:MAG: hypothetical protein FP816_06030 [Desulfobacteraceae bacterium]|nr:hypothetical protein [Desulfobacteraceae bacterium]MBU4053266.1 SWIM zinc finger family protein [Pseudomonadota bacterium]